MMGPESVVQGYKWPGKSGGDIRDTLVGSDGAYTRENILVVVHNDAADAVVNGKFYAASQQD